MHTWRPPDSAISRQLAKYKAELERMPLGELAAIAGEWNREPNETQLLALTGQPGREELINELIARRELDLVRLTPLEIDDLLDEEVI